MISVLAARGGGPVIAVAQSLGAVALGRISRSRSTRSFSFSHSIRRVPASRPSASVSSSESPVRVCVCLLRLRTIACTSSFGRRCRRHRRHVVVVHQVATRIRADRSSACAQPIPRSGGAGTVRYSHVAQRKGPRQHVTQLPQLATRLEIERDSDQSISHT